MGAARRVGGVVVGGVVAVAVGVLVAAAMPSAWHVERSVVIDAPPEVVHGYVGDLARWEAWTPWNAAADATLVREVEGGRMSWKGDAIGHGELVVISSDPKVGLAYEMILEDDGFPAKGRIAYAPEGAATKVTWTDEGDVGANPLLHLFVPMVEDSLEKDFDAALAKLDALAEADAKALLEVAAPAVAPEPAVETPPTP